MYQTFFKYHRRDLQSICFLVLIGINAVNNSFKYKQISTIALNPIIGSRNVCGFETTELKLDIYQDIVT